MIEKHIRNLLDIVEEKSTETKQQLTESTEQVVAEDIASTRREVNLKKKVDKGIATPEQKKEYQELKAKNMGQKPKKDQGVQEGLAKAIKRGLQGWGGVEDDPKTLVKRNKAHDIETAKMLRKGLDDAPEHSPAGLQKRVLDRRLKGVAEAAKWRSDDLEDKTWRNADWDDGDMSPGKIAIDRSGKDVDDSGDELKGRPGSWRGAADMAKRMTKKGVPTKAELGFQSGLKHHIKHTKRMGGLTGPKGMLPEEQGVAEGIGMDSIKHGDIVLKFEDQSQHGKMNLYIFSVIQNGEEIASATYDDYYDKLTIEGDDFETLPPEHPLTKKVKAKIQSSKDLVDEAYDPYDEADVFFKVGDDGRMKRATVNHINIPKAKQLGWSETKDQALRKAGIMRSKFDPKKYVKNVGGKWVQVYPYGQKDVTEGAMGDRLRTDAENMDLELFLNRHLHHPEEKEYLVQFWDQVNQENDWDDEYPMERSMAMESKSLIKQGINKVKK